MAEMTVEERLRLIERQLEKLNRAIAGEPDTGSIGLLKRLENLESRLNAIEAENKQRAAIQKGIAIGLSITSTGTIIAVLRSFLVGAP